MNTRHRPLSPHLQVYHFNLTMWLSAAHRLSRLFLALGAIGLVFWLLAVADGPQGYATARELAGSWPGQVLLLAWALSLFFHLCNGVRHLGWDIGVSLAYEQARSSGAVAVVTACLLWAIAVLLAYRVLPGMSL